MLKLRKLSFFGAVDCGPGRVREKDGKNG